MSLASIIFVLSLTVFKGQIVYANNDLLYTSMDRKLYIIPIHGEINRKMVIFLKRSVKEIKKDKKNIAVFDIDTFGGRIDSALEITTIIGSMDPVLTVAYINAESESKGVSWSAGALISFSCNKIYMAPGTSIGAAAPVTLSQGGMKAASEKVVSAVRTQMAALAEKNGYPPDVAKAMVDKDIELKEVWINGRIQLVSTERIEEIIKKEKKEGGKVEIGRIISKSGKLLTLTAKEMEKYGISSGTPRNIEELALDIGVKSKDILYLNQNQADKIIGFITSPGIIALLIAIGLVSLYIEITTPGFGIPGTVAIISFAIIFIGNALLGTVNSLELLLFLVGVILLILEILIIPGFGIAGISGIILIVVALVLSMQKFVIPSFSWQRRIIQKNFLIVGIGVITSFLIFGILMFFLPKLRIFHLLTLTTEQKKETGYTVQSKEIVNKYIGKRGVAITNLRPAGKAKINNEIVDVESDGEFIEESVEVEVIDVSSNRILVRKC